VNDKAREIGAGALRGVVGALAMTGMRQFAAELGLIGKTPPEELADKAQGLGSKLPAERGRAAVLTLHCAVGAAGGVGFGMLPDSIRQQAWAGPAWGIVIWLTYELAVEPLLGLGPVKRDKPTEHAAIIADHLLYGYVISETRGQPRN
jgi:hypothetical protein